MSGRVLVPVMLLFVVLLASASWWYGLSKRRDFVHRAESLGVPLLTREQAAAEVARHDKFGLPSRLDQAPERDVARYLRAGTRSEPLSADPAGIALLLEARQATFSHCYKTTKPDDGKVVVHAEIVVGHADEMGVVGSVTVRDRDSDAWRAFGQCATRLLRPVVFRPPVEASYRQTVELQLK